MVTRDIKAIATVKFYLTVRCKKEPRHPAGGTGAGRIVKGAGPPTARETVDGPEEKEINGDRERPQRVRVVGNDGVTPARAPVSAIRSLSQTAPALAGRSRPGSLLLYQYRFCLRKNLVGPITEVVQPMLLFQCSDGRPILQSSRRPATPRMGGSTRHRHHRPRHLLRPGRSPSEP